MVLSPERPVPVKRGLWTWHSPLQMIFSSSIGLKSWPQSIYSLGVDIYVNHPQSPPSHLQDYSTCVLVIKCAWKMVTSCCYLSLIKFSGVLQILVRNIRSSSFQKSQKQNAFQFEECHPGKQFKFSIIYSNL